MPPFFDFFLLFFFAGIPAFHLNTIVSALLKTASDKKSSVPTNPKTHG
jgi:hypothetical protein